MFKPPSMLEIVAALYDSLDVAQKLPRHEKLAYKDHRTLSRHQLAYATMTPRLLSCLAHEGHAGLKNYLGNVQRFFCTLNEAAYETDLEPARALEVYWQVVFSPMLAALLYHFRDERNQPYAIHHIGTLLLSWDVQEEPAERARWAKEAIKARYEVKVPLFTQAVNNIRSDNIQSRRVINNNMAILDQELRALSHPLREQILAEVSACYNAVMIIRRLEEVGKSEYLLQVRDLLQACSQNPASNLMVLHNRIAAILLQDHSMSFFQWMGDELILTLDKYIVPNLQSFYPGIVDKAAEFDFDAEWPEIEALDGFLFEMEIFPSDLSPLGHGFVYYWLMHHYIEHGNLETAFRFSQKFEQIAEQVHTGRFRAYNLLHKIVLHWAIKGKMQHNQFDNDIAQLIMMLPDEIFFLSLKSEKGFTFFSQLDDNEQMLLRLFREFNLHHVNHQVDPLQKLTEIMQVALTVCEDNRITTTELFPVFKKGLSKNILRTQHALPFTKRLTYSDAVEILEDLYFLAGLNLDDTIMRFQRDPRCKELVLALGSR
ncbi:hypothetical protein EXT66_17575 [Pectobacterium carotovorum subsp. carotovorum]|nr:hypothetical protein [Pectobacterium carotovorum]MCL6335689.1 hypothetical protein [Pectobacterium carotovorum subsp. carotovorum]MCL6348605.1 hypothetical protein [Pectobacterium carotovorum subsp. carotovorum]MCL6403067.1 hypothetical protein [Pectobacterium carotovorum subsp. carotovorum]